MYLFWKTADRSERTVLLKAGVFVVSFLCSAWLKGKFKNRAWFKLSLETRVEPELGWGSAQNYFDFFWLSTRSLSHVNYNWHNRIV